MAKKHKLNPERYEQWMINEDVPLCGDARRGIADSMVAYRKYIEAYNSILLRPEGLCVLPVTDTVNNQLVLKEFQVIEQGRLICKIPVTEKEYEFNGK